ncbi:unannotated protein [freshwater metagenome]|uniref:Unannotated protein n=1 Tax=freshwater metagenome TaxID=449393 RepID=A0A6J7RLJ2_9ZZZZ|nr:MerR family DNA-binding transcriptional regulator [Actinomycetota bacterium]MSV94751.1 MerR family DNA-binding transcriptional regulator [Actinomycetota bacterium]MSY45631.1 MerR family DNA-binding transcriptional regulator [Actinomycetota bacterium]
MSLIESNEPDAHLSISDVLESLREEFPDITISKIRFLEGQGLLEPERTPSGYRKFSNEDLDRLRWILEQQRDNFLPLKIIKERLGDPGFLTSEVTEVLEVVEVEPVNDVFVPIEILSPESDTGSEIRLEIFSGLSITAAEVVMPTEGDEKEKIGSLSTDDSRPIGGLSRTELLVAAGLTDAQLDDLIEYGLIVALSGAGDKGIFGDDALEVATLAISFYQRGIEARHLKMYRHFADREGALFAQILRPYLRQRNPESLARLDDELEELARLSRSLRTEMLRRSLKDELSDQ